MGQSEVQRGEILVHSCWCCRRTERAACVSKSREEASWKEKKNIENYKKNKSDPGNPKSQTL